MPEDDPPRQQKVVKKDTESRKNRNRSTSIAVLLWCHRESNQGHKDFQSFALPTELWHQFSLRTTLSFDWDCKGRYFFFISKLFMKYFLGFYFVSSQSHWALWSKNITYQ